MKNLLFLASYFVLSNKLELTEVHIVFFPSWYSLFLSLTELQYAVYFLFLLLILVFTVYILYYLINFLTKILLY